MITSLIALGTFFAGALVGACFAGLYLSHLVKGWRK